MLRDADQREQELLKRNEMQGPVFKMRDDPRITRFGRFLGGYSPDELPQLWSVEVRRHESGRPTPATRDRICPIPILAKEEAIRVSRSDLFMAGAETC